MALEIRSINSGSGLDIDGFDEGNQNKFVQSVYPKYDWVDFGGSTVLGQPQVVFQQKNTTGASTAFNCSGRARVVFKIEFNNTNTTATFRIWFKDNNNTSAWRPTTTVSPTNVGTPPSGVSTLQAGYSHGVGFSIDTEGAATFIVQMTALSNPGVDNVSMWWDGI